MSDNTASPAIPATLTERELFDEFARDGFPIYDEYSGELLVVEMPIDALSRVGNYASLEGFTEQAVEEIETTDDPSEYLEMLIDDLEDYLSNVRSVQRGFESLRATREVESAGDDKHTRYAPRVASEHEAA